MSNHGESANLIINVVDKGGVDEKSLESIFQSDNDFTENEDYFRPDTLKKGFKNEAERVSAEIFKKLNKLKKYKGDELALVDAMVQAVFDVPYFIGKSDLYGDYTYDITETDFQYIISIAYVS